MRTEKEMLCLSSIRSWIAYHQPNRRSSAVMFGVRSCIVRSPEGGQPIKLHVEEPDWGAFRAGRPSLRATPGGPKKRRRPIRCSVHHVARIPGLYSPSLVARATSSLTSLAPCTCASRSPCASNAKCHPVMGNEGSRFRQDYVRRLPCGQAEGAYIHHLLQEP